MALASNMKSNKGNPVPNQFIITTAEATFFQSYNSIIVKIDFDDAGKLRITLDKTYWNYSRTTSKYRNQFLGESTDETIRKINSGKYLLKNLNR